MNLARPRKRPVAFLLVGLFVAASLGASLWYFKDLWLPYWLSQPHAEPLPTQPAALDATPAPQLPTPPPLETMALDPAPPELDFLSAAVWDHPQFLQGVRAFNQALDRQRRYLADRTQAALLVQAEDGATQAAQLFEALLSQAPASVPLKQYAELARRLAAESRHVVQPPPSAAAQKPASPLPPSAIPTAEELRKHPDYVEGARLFNKALEQFNQYRANTARTELLQPAENLARQAGQKFEALKKQAPDQLFAELDRQIHQCYGIVSACRGAQLKNEGSTPAQPFDRGSAGPNRRPALPAYQPPQ